MNLTPTELQETIRVLLIDDQSLTDFLLRKMLAGVNNLELYFCASANDAMRVAEACQPTLILMDYYLGGVSGLELLRNFRNHYAFSEIPIIMLSVEEQPERKALAFAEGANDYLVKLPDREEMIARIRYHSHSYFNTLRRQKAEEKYRKLFEHSNDAVFLSDTETGEIIDCNNAACRLMALPREILLGMHHSDLFPPEARDRYRSIFKLALSKLDPRDENSFIQRADKELVPVTLTTATFQQGSHSFTQWVLRDVSERRQLLQSLEEVLSVAEKASLAKSEFLASMSHEIRTPLNIIIGRAELLMEATGQAEILEHAQLLSSASESLLELINNILDLSKIDAGRLSLEYGQFELLPLLEEVTGLFQMQAKQKGLLLQLETAPYLPKMLLADKLRLKQILFNLLNNAIRFTKEGQVQLKVKRANRAGEEGMLVFVVNDTGIGIPAEKQEMIFDPFTQADASIARNYGGTGLGLAICNRLVQLMGGRLKLNSQEGKGSTFFFTLPTATMESELPVQASLVKASAALPVEERRYTYRPLDILLVDDSEDNILLIKAYLKSSPHYIDTARNGEEAVEKFRHHTFDLILMDLQMPGMDGLEACRVMRTLEKQRGSKPVQIVAVTAFVSNEYMEKSFHAGFDQCYTKPVKKDRILEIIHSVTPEQEEE
ncbi:MAG: response regulator [Magnetococcales bacterium]|nr:response regulator [Magnetococcales bacterium]NGZ26610.1 response regulator [Magnetococcales bacterium]